MKYKNLSVFLFAVLCTDWRLAAVHECLCVPVRKKQDKPIHENGHKNQLGTKIIYCRQFISVLDVFLCATTVAAKCERCEDNRISSTQEFPTSCAYFHVRRNYLWHEQMKMVIWSVFIDVFSPGTTRLDCQYTQWPEWQWWRGDIKMSSEIRKNANFFPTWHTSESSVSVCVRLCERSSGWMKINRGRVFTLILVTHRTTTERQTNEQSFFFAAAAVAVDVLLPLLL